LTKLPKIVFIQLLKITTNSLFKLIMIKNFFSGIFGVSILIISLIFWEVNVNLGIKPSNLFVPKQENVVINSQEKLKESETENVLNNREQNLKLVITNIDQIYEVLYKKKQGMPAMLPNEYRDYYDNYKYKNVDIIQIKPFIFNNQEVDKRIRKIAEERGYKLRYQAKEVGLVEAEEGYKLQPNAKEAWLELKAAAAKDGVILGFTAAYRSFDDQRDLFLTEFKNNLFTPEQIANGKADDYINQVLKSKAIPGYSKHHTGYTVDIEDRSKNNKPGTLFKDSGAYKWLSANNYEKARKFNFIPSYPVGGTDMGPSPESWEYVWVQRL
jgi:LAS superfamily LD-carboxypeptidase LdcB